MCKKSSTFAADLSIANDKVNDILTFVIDKIL